MFSWDRLPAYHVSAVATEPSLSLWRKMYRYWACREEEEVLRTDFGDERRSQGEAIMTHPLTPRVFVSAASSDLRSARKVVNDALTRIECLPIEESVFGTEYGPIRELLARKIESCQAVIHLVGRDFGGEPDSRTLPAGQPRRSWTQIEYDLAQEQKRKLYLLVCDDAFPFDPLAVPEPAEKCALQLAHRQAVLADQHLWHTVWTLDELQQQVERMKLGLDLIRAELATVGETVMRAQQETVRQLTDPAALAETIRKQIHATAEAKIKALPAEQGRWQRVTEIERERDVALGRVDDLIKLIQEGLKEGASPVFQRATEILNDAQHGGTDAALAYLLSRRPNTLEIAQHHAQRAEAERDERNRSLQPLLLEAELLETKLRWLTALPLREQVAELAPDWFEARVTLGTLHCKLARFAAAEPQLRAAAKLAGTPDEESWALNELAQLLKATNRLAEAEPLMRRALALDEQSYGAEHPYAARHLNNLAALLQATNRLADAEPLMRRCVAIFHQFGQKASHEHPRMQTVQANYRAILQTMKLSEDEIAQRVKDATATVGSLKPIVPEVERLLGPAKPVADVLAALDRQYKEEDKPPIYFLRPDQPMAPHLDQLLGRSKLDVPLNEPIVPHLEKLLGPAKSTQEVFETLDRQSREQHKPAIWFLPLSQPIAPHLDELLGPLPAKEQE